MNYCVHKNDKLIWIEDKNSMFNKNKFHTKKAIEREDSSIEKQFEDTLKKKHF